MTLIDEENVKFDIVLKENTWLGLNLGATSMEEGSDYLRFIAAGQNSKFRDEHIRSNLAPGLDTINNLNGTFTTADGEVKF